MPKGAFTLRTTSYVVVYVVVRPRTTSSYGRETQKSRHARRRTQCERPLSWFFVFCCKRAENAENAGQENAGLENAGRKVQE